MKGRHVSALAGTMLFALLVLPQVWAADEPFTLKVYSTAQQPLPPSDNKIYKLMKERLGVNFQWDLVVGSELQKFGVMVASGDLPDLVYLTADTSPKILDINGLVPLEDLITKYAPNLRRVYAGLWEKMKAPDGHIYLFPGTGAVQGKPTDTTYQGPAMWIQKAVMKEAGYPKITTIDEYFQLVRDYKSQHPKTADGKPTIGFGILTYDWAKFMLINPPPFLAGNPNDGGGVVDKKTFVFKAQYPLDIAKRWYKILNEQNALGVVDRDAFIDNRDQYLAKIANGQMLAAHDQGWHFPDSSTALISQGKVWQTWMPLPIVFDKNIKPWWRDRTVPNLTNGYGITSKAKDPVRIIKFLDAQITDEWQKIFFWGIQGEDYQLNVQGVPFRTPEQRRQQEDPSWILHNKANLWTASSPKVEGSYSDGNAVVISDIPGEYQASLHEEDREVLKAYKVSSYAELMDPNPPPNPVYYPAWQLSPPDSTPGGVAARKAETAYMKNLPKVIFGKTADFDKNWKTYLDDLAKANLGEYEKYIQAGINQRLKTWGKP